MAYKLPNGSTVHLATGFAAEKTATAVSNAAEAVVTSASHGLADGDWIVLQSGWAKLDGRVFAVTGIESGSFKLKGIDTADTAAFPAGAGTGRFRKITTWQRLPQVLEPQASGGEAQYATVEFLEDDTPRQIPTGKSPQTITFRLADDPKQPWYAAAKKADESKTQTPLRWDLADGSKIAFNGFFSMSDMPNLTRNEIMSLQVSYAVNGMAVRINA